MAVITRTQRTIVVAAAVAALVISSNASAGAYFSQSWGWMALAFLVPSTLLLILDRVTGPGRLRIGFALLMAALGAWIALSTIWSISQPASAREVERMLVYISLALAVALVLRRGDGAGVLAGGLVGITLVSGYGLTRRLLPEHFAAEPDPIFLNRLAEPLGFPNSLGALAAIGLLISLGFVSHSRGRAAPAAAAFAAPILATTLYLTFSRAALGALGVGLVAMIAIDPRRLAVLSSALVVAMPSGAAVFYASRHDALTRAGNPSVDAVSAAGRRVMIVLLVCSIAGAAAGMLVSGPMRRRVPSRSVQRSVIATLVVVALLFTGSAIVAVGGPSRGVDRLLDQFDTPPRRDDRDLNTRLFSLYGTGRAELWRVALGEFEDAPIAGIGAGTFEYSWYEKRPTTRTVRDAHSLYLETLTEIGLVGLALIVVTLLVPLAAAVNARRSRYVAPAAAAYVVWLTASALDWHWEMVGLTSTALLTGSVGLLAAERRSRRGTLLPGTRIALIGVTGTLSFLAVWSLVGNQALFAGREALARKDWAEAREHARRAQALLVWSHEPDLVLGDAAAGLGDREGTLRAYRAAVEKDPQSWVAWLRLAQVERGAARAAAYDRVHQLNPLEESLPGE